MTALLKFLCEAASGASKKIVLNYLRLGVVLSDNEREAVATVSEEAAVVPPQVSVFNLWRIEA